MRKIRFLFYILFLLILPSIVCAKISITSEIKKEYTMGDTIGVSIKITPETTDSGLLSARLRCGGKEIQYYAKPINLEKGKEIKFSLPEIRAIYEGLCNILINIDSLYGENIDGIKTRDFLVTTKVNIDFEIDKKEIMPGEEFSITGSIKKGSNEKIEEKTAFIVFNQKKEELRIDSDGSFHKKIKVPEDIRSGSHTVRVIFEPWQDISYSKSKEIVIKPLAKRLESKINKNAFLPNEKLRLLENLYDQADEPMDGKVLVTLYRKSFFRKKTILNTKIPANKEFEYVIDASIKPGDYVLEGSYKKLKDKREIRINGLKDIDIRLENQNIIINNIGNLPYREKIRFLLEKDGKEIILTKRLSLDVGEDYIIDLSQELPTGNYKIKLPNNNTITNVYIEDKRSIPKKIFQGVVKITGNIVYGGGYLAKHPKLGVFIMVLVIIILFIYYGKGKIGKFIGPRGK